MTRREFSRTALAWAAASRLSRPLRAQSSNPHLTSVDTHAHIFEHRLKLARVHRYAPTYDATLADYLGQLDAHGIARGVLIQPSFLGVDNDYLVQALLAQPQRLRGVAVVEADASAARLTDLAGAGVVGIRLNLVGEEIPRFAAAPWTRLFQRLAELDWQVEVHREARDLPRIVGPILDAGLKVVVDHFGRPDPKLGVDDPGFRYLLQSGPGRRVWVKLSGAYRNGGNARGEAIAQAAVPLLRQSFGADRLLWGSDWPHTQFESLTNYAAAVAAFQRWITDPAERASILQDNPRSLYRFS